MSVAPGVHRNWIDRPWSFDFPADLYPEAIERLRGTPLRLAAAVEGLDVAALTRRAGYEWSIQENAGHLGDLDALFDGRLDDFLAGAAELRPADMTNRRTNEAGHNHRPLADVLANVRTAREGLVARLEALAPADFASTAHHGRLGRPMRLVDQCVFQATHDDYHLAIIRGLRRAAGSA